VSQPVSVTESPATSWTLSCCTWQRKGHFGLPGLPWQLAGRSLRCGGPGHAARYRLPVPIAQDPVLRGQRGARWHRGSPAGCAKPLADDQDKRSLSRGIQPQGPRTSIWGQPCLAVFCGGVRASCSPVQHSGLGKSGSKGSRTRSSPRPLVKLSTDNRVLGREQDVRPVTATRCRCQRGNLTAPPATGAA